MGVDGPLHSALPVSTPVRPRSLVQLCKAELLSATMTITLSLLRRLKYSVVHGSRNEGEVGGFNPETVKKVISGARNVGVALP